MLSFRAVMAGGSMMIAAALVLFAGWAVQAFPPPTSAALADPEERDTNKAALTQKRIVVETDDNDTNEPATKQKRIIVRAGQPDGKDREGRSEVAWLGIGTEEASDALASQLGLKPGEGLVVTFVASNSPAAKAGLEKNDLLVEFDGQRLVLPAQLRKLVQTRKEGDTVSLVIYRGGQKQTLSATLGKTKATVGLFEDEGMWEGGLRDLHLKLRDLGSADALREHLHGLHESLARSGIDKEKLEKDIRRGAEEVRKAIEETVRQATKAGKEAGAAGRALGELARSGVEVDGDATVTIKNRSSSNRTIVKTDNTGTYVIIANPKKRLTAHDKNGKMLFDGEIETSEQQAKVPKDVWKKVKPMLEQMKPLKDQSPDSESAPAKKTSTAPRAPFYLCADRWLSEARTLIAMARYLLEPDPTPPASLAGTNSTAYSVWRGPIQKA